jgi:prepilin-type N-terminal cleavage/methylation domain-containing protein
MKIKIYFTLVELLVVIVIIAILITLLLPSLLKAKNRALDAVCLLNEYQLGVAMQIYQSEFDNYYPPHQTPVPAGPLDWTGFAAHA